MSMFVDALTQQSNIKAQAEKLGQILAEIADDLQGARDALQGNPK